MLKILGWALAGLLLFVFVLLLLPVRTRVRFDGALQVWAGLGPVSLRVFPMKKKPKSEKEKAQAAEKKAAKKAQKEAKKASKPKKEKPKRKWTLEVICEFIHLGLEALGMLRRRLVLSNLEQGYYKLVEITAPDGYYRLTEEIYFISEEGDITVTGGSRNWSFSTSSNTLTVINVSGSELPSTGGMGTHYGTMAGLLIMASSLLYGFQLRRKRERRAD